MTGASKEVAALVFMAVSVHEQHAHEQAVANRPDMTSEHDLALTARLRDGQPAPAFQFVAATLLRDERAPAIGSRPGGTELPRRQRALQPDLLSRPCGTDDPQRVVGRTASLAAILGTTLPEAPEAFWPTSELGGYDSTPNV